jgi:hypothetical protein
MPCLSSDEMNMPYDHPERSEPPAEHITQVNYYDPSPAERAAQTLDALGCHEPGRVDSEGMRCPRCGSSRVAEVRSSYCAYCLDCDHEGPWPEFRLPRGLALAAV